jgi:hypothetical protein
MPDGRIETVGSFRPDLNAATQKYQQERFFKGKGAATTG